MEGGKGREGRGGKMHWNVLNQRNGRGEGREGKGGKMHWNVLNHRNALVI